MLPSSKATDFPWSVWFEDFGVNILQFLWDPNVLLLATKGLEYCQQCSRNVLASNGNVMTVCAANK